MRSPAQYFRAGTGAVIVNADGLVLACERADFPGAWQLPQGGLEDSEEPIQGAFREIVEETGIAKDSLELLDTYPEPLVYELPARRRSEKTGRGQVQYWFLFRFHGADSGIDVNKTREFRAWQWMSFDRLLKGVAEMRKPVYRRLAERFKGYFSESGAED